MFFRFQLVSTIICCVGYILCALLMKKDLREYFDDEDFKKIKQMKKEYEYPIRYIVLLFIPALQYIFLFTLIFDYDNIVTDIFTEYIGLLNEWSDRHDTKP